MTGAGEGNRRADALFGGLLALYAVAAGYSIKGLRGSDQYWYHAEIEAILAGTAPYYAFFFPGAIWRNETLEGVNAFTHHTAVHYLALPGAIALGPYLGWVLTGIALTVVAGFLVRWMVRDASGNSWAGAIAGGLFLLSPVVFWSSINMLQESYQAALIVMLGFGVYRARGSVGWSVALLAVLAVGCGVHPIFLPMTLAWALAAYWVMGPTVPRGARIGVAAGALVVLALAVTLVGDLFPATPTHSSIIVAAEGQTNSAGYFEYDLAEVSLGLIARKTVRSAVHHVTQLASGSIVFYALFYVVLIGAALFARQVLGDRQPRLLALLGATLLLLGGYVGLTCLHQVQPRYMLLVYPLALVGAAIAIAGLVTRMESPRAGTLALAAAGLVLLGCFGIDALMARRVRSQAVAGAAYLGELEALIGDEDKAPGPILGVVSAETKGAGVQIGYVGRPRHYMTMLPFHLDDARSAEVLARYAPKTLVAEKRVPDLESRLGALGFRLERLAENETHAVFSMRAR